MMSTQTPPLRLVFTLATIAGLTAAAHAQNVSTWQSSVQSVGSNVVTDTTTYTISNTTQGYNYGALTGLTTGATIEFVFNAASGSTIVGGWASANSSGTATSNVWRAKINQYSGTGLFGLSLSGVSDAKPLDVAANRSIYGSLVDFVLVQNTNGTVAAYVNGTLLSNGVSGYSFGAATFGSQFFTGGTGTIGAASGDTFNGTIYGVATYNTALSQSQVSANYAALNAVPEPSTYGLLGAGVLAGVALVRRRKIV